jgi:hypothetical protein
MYSATFQVRGTHYQIVSNPIQVPNMEAEFQKIARFVAERGGSCREFGTHPHQKHEWEGYYNGLSFRSEFFLEGILINLLGITLREQKYFVNPSRRNLSRDLRSGSGVCLTDFDKYESYARDRVMSLNEQIPELLDGGILTLSLEGAVRHLAQDAPEFYAVTGLPKDWTPSLRLLTHEQYRDEQEVKKIRDGLLVSKNWIGYTKQQAIDEYAEAYAKHPEIFDEVWTPKRSRKKKQLPEKSS